MLNRRASDRSTSTTPGPVRILRPASPKVFVGGSKKQLVLNHSPTVLGPLFGSQPAATFGRSELCKVPLMLPLSYDEVREKALRKLEIQQSILWVGLLGSVY